MFLPHPVIEQLSQQQVATWVEHFAGSRHERPRSIEEGIWRRTQDPSNAEQSGWKEDSTGRRRVVHFRYTYDLDYTQPVPRLVLSELYLFCSHLAPVAEIDAYTEDLNRWLAEGRWRKKDDVWHRGDLVVAVAQHEVHPQDERAIRDTPAGFRSLDVCITSEGFTAHRSLRNLPWDVLAGGMRPGIGYGGGCLPKDTGAFTWRVRDLGATHAHALLQAVEGVNHSRMDAATALVERALGAPLNGARIAVLGASFKAGTSDVRNSPALRLAGRLHDAGARAVIYDPESTDAARNLRPQYTYAGDTATALDGADIVVLATEWPQFTKDAQFPSSAGEAVRCKVLVDVRNAVDSDAWVAAGWEVWQLGRPVQRPEK